MTQPTADEIGIGGHLSHRVARALQPGLPYFRAFGEAQKRPWSKEDPMGVINIVVAENKLAAAMVHVSIHSLIELVTYR